MLAVGAAVAAMIDSRPWTAPTKDLACDINITVTGMHIVGLQRIVVVAVP